MSDLTWPWLEAGTVDYKVEFPLIATMDAAACMRLAVFLRRLKTDLMEENGELMPFSEEQADNLVYIILDNNVVPMAIMVDQMFRQAGLEGGEDGGGDTPAVEGEAGSGPGVEICGGVT